MTIFINNLLKGKSPIIFGDGNQTRDFIFVEDVVSASIKALTCREKPSQDLIFHVGTSIETSINELYKTISKIFNLKIQPRYVLPRPGDLKKELFGY